MAMTPTSIQQDPNAIPQSSAVTPYGSPSAPVPVAARPGETAQGNNYVPPGMPSSLWSGTPQEIAQQQSGEAGNFYQNTGAGQTWMRPNGGNNTSWMYGASAPTAGVDQRAWSNVYDPNAFQYGGQQGGAGIEQNRYANMGTAAAGNAAPQMNLSGYNDTTGGYSEGQGGTAALGQYGALQMMQQAASGNGPSVAQAQLQQGIAQSQRAQMQQAAGARGGGANLVAAETMGAQNASNLQSQGLGQAATLRAQEMLGAQQAYAGQANAMRSSALQQGGLESQMAYQQAGLQSGQNSLNQQGQLAYEAMRQGVFNSQLSAQQAGEAQNANTGMTASQLAWQQQQANSQWQRQLIGGAITAAGTVGGAMIGGPAGAVAGNAAGTAVGGAVAGAATSDVRAKSNIRDGSAAIDQTLGQMGAYQYEYNRPDLPGGTQTGTMAQQLLGTPAGAPLVARDQHGRLVIQGPQATNFSLAALARLNDRVQQLEGQQGGGAAPGQIGPPPPPAPPYAPPPGTKLYEPAASTAPRHNPLTGAAYSYHPSDEQIYSDRAKAMQIARGVGPDPNVIPEHDTFLPAATYAEMLRQQQKNEARDQGMVTTQGIYNAGR